MTTNSTRLTRRRLLTGTLGAGVGTAALAYLPGGRVGARPHHPPRAKRMIFLYQSGGPSHLETFDHKPDLIRWDGQELPESVRGQQRLTTMTSNQSALLVRSSQVGFTRSQATGVWVSDHLPRLREVSDRISVIRSLHTDAINHDPAATLLFTGAQLPGRPSLGAWLDYGLGPASGSLPGFVVLLPKTSFMAAQPLYQRMWGSGFLPPVHQGVRLRSGREPVLFLDEGADLPPVGGDDLASTVRALNDLRREDAPDRIEARNRSFEVAMDMRRAVPELVDTSAEAEDAVRLYGEGVTTPGSYAASCHLARRLLERGVRFVQILQRGWDHHEAIGQQLPRQCQEVDQPTAGLILDLEERGLLEATMVVWMGEFGRTVYGQGSGSDFGRDHHPRCFSGFLAGGGIRPGEVVGATDDFGYNVIEAGVHVHDVQATLLHQLGFDHTRLTYRFQGRDFRLTDVHGKVVEALI